jgi:hypothetical protein
MIENIVECPTTPAAKAGIASNSSAKMATAVATGMAERITITFMCIPDRSKALNNTIRKAGIIINLIKLTRLIYLLKKVYLKGLPANKAPTIIIAKGVVRLPKTSIGLMIAYGISNPSIAVRKPKIIAATPGFLNIFMILPFGSLSACRIFIA